MNPPQDKPESTPDGKVARHSVAVRRDGVAGYLQPKPRRGDAVRRRRRTGAAVLAWGALFFVCAQLALAVAMERWLPELRDMEYAFKLSYLRARQAEKPGRPLLLALGTSRTALGFRPDAVPADLPGEPVVFNFSLMGSGPVLELLCLKRLLTDGVRPRWVLLEYWPGFWDCEGEPEEAARVPVMRLASSDLRLLGRYADRPGALYGEWALSRSVPWSSNRFLVMAQYARTWVPAAGRREDLWRRIDGSGWLPYHGSAEPTEFRHRVTVASQMFGPKLQKYHVAPRSERAFREVLETCRRENIRVALLYLPEMKEFQGLYPAEVRAEIDQFLARMSAEYQAPLIDARDWLGDSAFGDGYHLLPDGAAAFTGKLGRETLPTFLKE